MAVLLQFLYMVLVGSIPVNSFLAGFLASVGFLTLTGVPPACLHSQKSRRLKP